MIRLLHIITKEFKEFYDLRSVPDYAILSHRWAHTQRNGKYRALEVSFAEFNKSTGDERGYEKIDKACEAVRHLTQHLDLDLEWIWIDSCCIDKNNNEEHTEAINSMYEWYARSYVCIAYLDDPDPFDATNPSPWFKRGWTLQELIAPERVLFYNKDWVGCGSRNEYSPGVYHQHSFQNRSETIAAITRIDTILLQLTKRKDIKRRLDSIPACQKMSWASDRKTTKDEDMAYCLIGIFDIPHMYLKRGEGRRAFIRLQEEIIKQSNDLTLFAWKLSGDADDACMDDNCLSVEDLTQNSPEDAPFFEASPNSELHGVFACGPGHFRHASRIEPTQLTVYNDEVTITSRGVKLTTPLLGSGPFLPFKMPLYCTDGDLPKLLSIELRLLGGSIYARTNCSQLPELHKDAKAIPNQDDVFLAHNVHRFQDCAGQMHKHAICLPETILGELRRIHVSPGYLWSSKHSLVITNGRRFFVGYANYQCNRSNAVATLLFGLDHLQRPWFCLSNADRSFEPHSLESRKLYLERVWRPASQHTKTAYLDDEKKFYIHHMTLFGPGVLQGLMQAVRRRYCDRDVFDVEFLYNWQSRKQADRNAAPDIQNAMFRTGTPEAVTDHSAGQTRNAAVSNSWVPLDTYDNRSTYVGVSAHPIDHSNPFIYDPPVGVSAFNSYSPGSSENGDPVGVSANVPITSEPSGGIGIEGVPTYMQFMGTNMYSASGAPDIASGEPTAADIAGVMQGTTQHQVGRADSPSTGFSIGITPQARPFMSFTAGTQAMQPSFGYQQTPPAHYQRPTQGPSPPVPLGYTPSQSSYPFTPRRASANPSPQYYEMQLMLLEEQNRRRLMMARQEQDVLFGGIQQQVQQYLPQAQYLPQTQYQPQTQYRPQTQFQPEARQYQYTPEPYQPYQQSRHADELEEIPEAREETPPVNTGGRGSSQEPEDQPMQDLENIQKETQEDQSPATPVTPDPSPHPATPANMDASLGKPDTSALSSPSSSNDAVD